MKDLFGNYDIDSGALFSDCKQYRYALWRIWDKSLPLVMFIGLNPSTANELEDDPTIRRVVGFSKKWGYGGVYMTNLFAYVSAYPEKLKECHDPIGKYNDRLLQEIYMKCQRQVIFAWGDFKEAKDRAKTVTQMFPIRRALIINKNGTPRHPLYVPGNTQPVKFL